MNRDEVEKILKKRQNAVTKGTNHISTQFFEWGHSVKMYNPSLWTNRHCCHHHSNHLNIHIHYPIQGQMLLKKKFF